MVRVVKEVPFVKENIKPSLSLKVVKEKEWYCELWYGYLVYTVVYRFCGGVPPFLVQSKQLVVV